jgi:nucleotide-binding universal stress UspA family protein
MSMQRIMVATDGSASADRAIEAAAALAKAVDGDLMIVTIGGNFPAHEVSKLARAEGGVGEANELLSDHVLLAAKERAQRAGAPKISIRSGWGDPATGIIDAVHRERPDILVVGRRGRGQLAGLLLGSVSQKMVSLASCIVVVVP